MIGLAVFFVLFFSIPIFVGLLIFSVQVFILKKAAVSVFKGTGNEKK